MVLASQSPRRQELLRQVGVRFEVAPADIDESPHHDEAPVDYVRRLAATKAETVEHRRGDGRPVLGADTVVVVDNVLLGKPRNEVHACEMLSRLSGRSHEVLSAVALSRAGTRVSLSRTRVWFRTLEHAEIEAYVETGEPLDKAGAYAIQGYAAAYVERIDGSYSGVMGLPLFETLQLLADCTSG